MTNNRIFYRNISNYNNYLEKEQKNKIFKHRIIFAFTGYLLILSFAVNEFNVNNTVYAYMSASMVVKEENKQMQQTWHHQGQKNQATQILESNYPYSSNNKSYIPSIIIDSLPNSSAHDYELDDDSPFPSSSSGSSISSQSSLQSAQIDSTQVFADFNGDGFTDLVIGVPLEDLNGNEDAGAVQVIYGSIDGLAADSNPDQLWTKNSTDIEGNPENFDAFGATISSGDYNGDGYDDLAIGTPGNDVLGVPDAGAVHVIYGSSVGLSATSVLADQLWTQDSADIEEVAEPIDSFGFSLSSGDYNDDGRDDLAIGATSEDIGSAIDAGAVHIIYGSSVGLSATSVLADQLWTQDSADIEEVAELNDVFGVTLSSGDYNNDGRGDLAIGVPFEDTDPGPIDTTGAVHVIYGSSPGGISAGAVLENQYWTQDSRGIEEVAEPIDLFGNSLVR
jgi:hypothetical protein